MVYLLFVLVATLSVVFVVGTAAQKGVVDCGKKIKIYKLCEDESVIPFHGKQLGMLIIICFVMALALQISLYKNTTIINVVKLYGVFVIVFCAAVVDIKRINLQFIRIFVVKHRDNSIKISRITF